MTYTQSSTQVKNPKPEKFRRHGDLCVELVVRSISSELKYGRIDVTTHCWEEAATTWHTTSTIASNAILFKYPPRVPMTLSRLISRTALDRSLVGERHIKNQQNVPSHIYDS